MSIVLNLDICFEYRLDFRQCFVKERVQYVFKKTYKDENDYVDFWLSVFNIEVVKIVVEEISFVVIRNVFLYWKIQGIGKKIYIAEFSLFLEFCKNRNIKFSNDLMLEDLFNFDNVYYVESYFMDFVCVRYCNF